MSHSLSLSHPHVIKVAAWVKRLLMDVALENDTPSLPSVPSQSQMFLTFLTSTLETSLLLTNPSGEEETDVAAVDTATDVFTLSCTLESMVSTSALSKMLGEEEEPGHPSVPNDSNFEWSSGLVCSSLLASLCSKSLSSPLITTTSTSAVKRQLKDLTGFLKKAVGTYAPHLDEGNLEKAGKVMADVIVGWERSKMEVAVSPSTPESKRPTPLGERNRVEDHQILQSQRGASSPSLPSSTLANPAFRTGGKEGEDNLEGNEENDYQRE
ncbi:hypothetical protein TrRE_jg9174, partial [Triparma retinervis]